ncbi:GDSL-type esterase/lipase family protein [Mechercharimyces sp. CAU 1602]|uniref:GDSL-type esterase/lipase family protein n=1 Tax=Mechercharimyces sp. CAU 1602 TaxID=2973933 RepID=UPI00216229C5|nr:GDSL-type esterase/lipase family protein [Mechercharimyces sp. CAU 1602]MCS1350497.1 GDSL-type esterase/lipase family protein [Mechercharimyces sp. CAU 1602]
MKKWLIAGVSGLFLITGTWLGQATPYLELFFKEEPEPVYQAQESILNTLKINSEHRQVDYLSIGDSVAMGKGSEQDEQGYTSHIERELEKENLQVTLDNQGISGQTSAELRSALETESGLSTKVKEADFITLTIGGNDLLKVVLEEKNPMKVLTEFPKIQAEFKTNLTAIMDQLTTLNPEAPIIVTTLYNPLSPQESYYDHSDNMLTIWNRGLKEVVYQYSTGYVVDVDEVLTPNPERSWLADEIHPNGKGYALMAAKMVKEIRGNAQASANAQFNR